jgi:hypothetical protein
MSARSEHLAKAEHNEELSYLLADANADGKGFEDWEVIALFYAAVHLVDARLAADNEHPTSHVEHRQGMPRGRNALVRQLLPLLWGDYRQLENLSHRARYEAGAQIRPSQVKTARQKHYANIRSWIRAWAGI